MITNPHTPISPRERLIVALDFPTASAALDLVDKLDGQCQWYKVGLELYLAEGASIVHKLRDRGVNVFLDLKFHDIPNTVAGAVRSAAATGANLLTIHAAGGPAMMDAAAEAVLRVAEAPRLLAVTVLTSMDGAQLNAVGVEGTLPAQVSRLSRLARAAGLSGVVCSAHEAAEVRGELGYSALIVVPGIRLADGSRGDQRRVATPTMAIGAGASMLVIGRPITAAADPGTALNAFLSEIEQASVVASI